MLNIKKQLLSSSRASKVTYGGTNSKKYIVIHETANEDVGANAQVHANLQSNGFSASWNYQVDEHGAIQSFSDNAQTWHAGSRYYNQNSIGIEICVNSDGNYSKAVDNAIELVKYLMKKYNISASNVIPHQKTSTWNKECPRYLLRGRYISWNTFKKRIGGTSSGVTSSGSSSKSSSSSSKPSGKLGLVDYLNSKNINSSYGNREKLAKKHGIKGYKGTGPQNTLLLSKIKGGGKAKSKPSSSSSYVGGRVESKTDGLNFYNKPTWKNPVGKVSKGSGFPTIVAKVKVGDGSQYKVKNSKGDTYYITASSKYVKVISSKTSKPKPKAKTKAKPKANLSVDGKWGKGVNKALQAHFGTTQDGILSGQSSNSATKALYGGVAYGKGGSVVIKKLQSYVGVKADGLLGPATVKALQAKLGTGQDGIISRPSSGVVKALQKKLNNGTF